VFPQENLKKGDTQVSGKINRTTPRDWRRRDVNFGRDPSLLKPSKKRSQGDAHGIYFLHGQKGKKKERTKKRGLTWVLLRKEGFQPIFRRDG